MCRNDRTIRATVTDKVVLTGNRYTYIVCYAFETRRREECTGWDTLGRDAWMALVPADGVAVLHLEDALKVNGLVEGKAATGFWAAVGLGAVIVGFGVHFWSSAG